MSLINDALKTAQRQRTALVQPPVEHPLFQGLIAYPAKGGSKARRERVLFGIAGALLIVAIAITGYTRFHTPRLPRVAPPAASAAKTSVAPPPRLTPNTVSASRDARLDKGVVQLAGTPAAPAKPVVQTQPVARTPQSAPATTLAAAPKTAPPKSSTLTDTAAKPRQTPAAAAPAAATVAAPPAGVTVTVEAGAARPVDALMAQALSAQRQGDLEGAKQLYDRAIKVGPAGPALYSNYGALLNAMGNSRDAVAMLRLALSFDRSFTNAWVNLAIAQDAMGDHAAAIASLEQSLKLDPSNRDSKVNLAEQFLAIGADRDARRTVEEVVKAEPNFAPAHYTLGRALEAGKDFAGAARELTRFLELGGAAGRSSLDASIRSHIAALQRAP